MIALAARPRLASRARIRHDPISGRTLLLYPERGLVLNETAVEILELCTGEATVSQIVHVLSARHGQSAAMAEEVCAFLDALADRNLLRGLEG